MTFFLTVGFLGTTLWLIARYRLAIADAFYRLPVSPRWAAVIAAAVFSIIEEASINLASGTLPVLLGTVPPLVLFTVVFGTLGRRCRARTIRYPLLALMLFGVLFEATVGGHRHAFQHPESAGVLIVGVGLAAMTYAYTAMVGLTMLIEHRTPRTTLSG